MAFLIKIPSNTLLKVFQGETGVAYQLGYDNCDNGYIREKKTKVSETVNQHVAAAKNV